MSFNLMLGVVLLATFGLINLALSGLVLMAWRAGLDRALTTTADFLALRLLPAAGGLLMAFTVVLPEFLRYEPRQAREAGGPLLMALATLGALLLLHGIWRGGRACLATQALLRSLGTATRRVIHNRQIQVVHVAEPILAVVGSLRPQILVAGCVMSRCSAGELDLMMEHEAAHVLARDNLKQLLLLTSPDLLAFTSLGAMLVARWRAAAEREADERAAGLDPRQRVLLAGALLKVARATGAPPGKWAALSMPVAYDDIDGRVRRLIAPQRTSSQGSKSLLIVIACLFGLPLAALPFHAGLQELIEELVRSGL